MIYKKNNIFNKKEYNTKNRKKAFTLIEMIAVLIILGIGSSIMGKMFYDFMGYSQTLIAYKENNVLMQGLKNLSIYSDNFDKCELKNENLILCNMKLDTNSYQKITKTKSKKIIKVFLENEDGTKKINLVNISNGIGDKVILKFTELNEGQPAIEFLYPELFGRKFYIFLP